VPTADTVRTAGVCDAEIVALNQFPPEDVCAVAVKLTAGSLATATVCIALAVTFCVHPRFTCEGVTLIVAAATTVSVIGTVRGLFPALADVTTIEPWYVPGTSPEGSTASRTDAGVCPMGEIWAIPVSVSHGVPYEMLAVNGTLVPLLVTRKLIGAGGGSNSRYVTASDDGVAMMVGAAEIVKVTGTRNGLFPAPVPIRTTFP
jgi:hypothetical protein